MSASTSTEVGQWWQCAYEQPSNLPGRPPWRCRLDAGHEGMHVMRRGEWERPVERVKTAGERL